LAFCVGSSLCDIWTDCSKSTDEFTIQKVVITPDPPKKGANLTVAVTGNYKTGIKSGTIHLTVKFSVITLLDKSLPLCGDLTTVTCPIAAGPWTHTISELIPGDAPGGSYTGKATISDDGTKGEIACITFGVKL